MKTRPGLHTTNIHVFLIQKMNIKQILLIILQISVIWIKYIFGNEKEKSNIFLILLIKTEQQIGCLELKMHFKY